MITCHTPPSASMNKENVLSVIPPPHAQLCPCTGTTVLCINSAPRTRLQLEMENVELTCHELSCDIFRCKKLKLSNCRETHLGWSYSLLFPPSLGMRPLSANTVSCCLFELGKEPFPPCIPQKGPKGPKHRHCWE